VQDRAPPRRGARDLLEPEAQAETGMILPTADCGLLIGIADCGLLIGIVD
jgi:hypothetical protein